MGMIANSGKINVMAAVALALGLGLAASVYLNIKQSQRAVDDHNLLQGQITDLQYQVKKDAEASAPAPSTPTRLATPEPSPTPAPVVAGTSSINVSQLGIKLTASDPVADLTYDMTTSGAYPVAALSTRALISKYPTCKPSAANTALGFIVQKKTGFTSTGKLIKQAGIYNYFYIAPIGFCAADTDGRNTLAAARAAVMNAVLPTLIN
ncbi:MAG: hypothetical protein NVSMB39_6680 [Candidatus Saccharimonadales bacterium]